MFEWWDKTVTVYHKMQIKDENGRTVTKWRRVTAQNCFYGNKTAQVLSGTEIVNKNQRFIRLKLKLPLVELKADDIAIIGEITEDVPDNTDARKLLDKYEGFVISTVKNYASSHFPLPHIFIGE